MFYWKLENVFHYLPMNDSWINWHIILTIDVILELVYAIQYIKLHIAFCLQVSYKSYPFVNSKSNFMKVTICLMFSKLKYLKNASM
jgi:hypothetical protein